VLHLARLAVRFRIGDEAAVFLGDGLALVADLVREFEVDHLDVAIFVTQRLDAGDQHVRHRLVPLRCHGDAAPLPNEVQDGAGGGVGLARPRRSLHRQDAAIEGGHGAHGLFDGVTCVHERAARHR
jgi:hypothetical protein